MFRLNMIIVDKLEDFKCSIWVEDREGTVWSPKTYFKKLKTTAEIDFKYFKEVEDLEDIQNAEMYFEKANARENIAWLLGLFIANSRDIVEIYKFIWRLKRIDLGTPFLSWISNHNEFGRYGDEK